MPRVASDAGISFKEFPVRDLKVVGDDLLYEVEHNLSGFVFLMVLVRDDRIGFPAPCELVEVAPRDFIQRPAELLRKPGDKP